MRPSQGLTLIAAAFLAATFYARPAPAADEVCITGDFVIGCASQTGDINTVSHAMRRITLIHGIVSFAFNTAILALVVNVSASLLN